MHVEIGYRKICHLVNCIQLVTMHLSSNLRTGLIPVDESEQFSCGHPSSQHPLPRQTRMETSAEELHVKGLELASQC